MAAKEHVTTVRTVKLPVDTVAGDWQGTVQRWHNTQQECRQVANMIWRVWERWHVDNDSIEKQKQWLNDREELCKKAAGPSPVTAVPPELHKELYYAIQSAFPNLHGRVWGLLLNKIIKTIKSRKAANGSLPGWVAILFCHEGRPSFTKPVPIEFDTKNSKLRLSDDGQPVVELRSYKPGDKDPSVVDVIRLWFKGRRVRGQYEGFKRIIAGEWKFCGSSLAYSKHDKRWYVHLAFQRPKHRAEGLNPERKAFLMPFRRQPFVFHEPGAKPRRQRWTWLQGRGHHIASVRRKVFNNRRDWNANYRLASQRKGHGHPGESPWSRSWRQFVKRVNHQVSHDAVTECVKRGIGQLVYVQPKGEAAGNRFVSTAGSTGRDQTTWEFFQLKTMLNHKCQDLGIQLLEVNDKGKLTPVKGVG